MDTNNDLLDAWLTGHGYGTGLANRHAMETMVGATVLSRMGTDEAAGLLDRLVDARRLQRLDDPRTLALELLADAGFDMDMADEVYVDGTTWIMVDTEHGARVGVPVRDGDGIEDVRRGIAEGLRGFDPDAWVTDLSDPFRGEYAIGDDEYRDMIHADAATLRAIAHSIDSGPEGPGREPRTLMPSEASANARAISEQASRLLRDYGLDATGDHAPIELTALGEEVHVTADAPDGGQAVIRIDTAATDVEDAAETIADGLDDWPENEDFFHCAAERIRADLLATGLDPFDPAPDHTAVFAR